MVKKVTIEELEELWNEDVIIPPLDDEDDNTQEIEQGLSFKKETYYYDYDVEEDYSIDEEIKSATQLQECISFDFIKLVLPLTEAEYVGFDVNRKRFFRCSYPEKPAKESESSTNPEFKSETIQLRKNEEEYTDKSMEYEYAKKKYPNAKLYYDYRPKKLGVGHMYFKDGCFVCQIGGKITASHGDLGLINKDNIEKALWSIKGITIKFDVEKFIEKAQVVSVHVTNDIKVADVNSNIKAFSSYLPLRTTLFNILMYGNYCGYEVLPRGKQTPSSIKHSLCIYSKGKEISSKKERGYKNVIGRSGVRLGNKTLRLELRLYNFKAIRTYLAPELEKGTITLQQLLNCTQKPILKKLQELGITKDSLIKARGEYISMLEDKLPTLAVFQRMHGIIHLLKLNNYSLDKVRSHIETETGLKIRSDELKKDREALQRYIACYKPRTVALLNELLACMSY